MGRPTASLQVKSASLAFVRMITRVTGDTLDMLARCGCCSVFSVLREVAPSLARLGDSGNRDGISEVELNKLLQVHMHLIQKFFCLHHGKLRLMYWNMIIPDKYESVSFASKFQV